VKTPSSSRLADYVKPRLGEARICRMWAVVAQAQQPVSTHRFERWAMIGALAAAACIALILWIRPWNVAGHSHVAQAVAGGDTFATEANQRQVTLPDGSVLSMGQSTRIEVVQLGASDVRLRLLHGVLTCDVPHIEGRLFLVEAGSADVTVKGTRFTVELQPEAATSRGHVGFWAAMDEPKACRSGLRGGNRRIGGTRSACCVGHADDIDAKCRLAGTPWSEGVDGASQYGTTRR